MTYAIELTAPLSGPVIPLEQVPDPVFAGRMMGDGIAIDPLSSRLLAPCDGVVAQLARTANAITLTADNGAEILLHIGIDTVQLGGVGFHACVAEGERVARGQCLIEVDLDAVGRRAPSLITLLVVPNGDLFRVAQRAGASVLAGQSPLLTVAPLDAVAEAGAAAGPSAAGAATVRHEGGLHARPSALVQNAARAFRADISIEFQGRRANAKSMVALMGLSVAEDDRVHVLAQGEDAEQAVVAVIAALQKRSKTDHAPVAASAGPIGRVLEDGRIAGVCAAPGLAVGSIVCLDQTEPVFAETAGNAGDERDALSQALQTVRQDISQTISEALRRGATAESDIFTAHLALLDDPELAARADGLISGGKSAGFAFGTAVEEQCRVLASLGNSLLAERVGDLKDLRRRVARALAGADAAAPVLPASAILLAEDITPSQLTSLPREQVAGMITAAGGATAHVAILARALGIPALVACGAPALALEDGRTVLLDAGQGVCDPAPSAKVLADAEREIARLRQRREQMQACASASAVTLDGVSVEVAVNIANAADACEGLAYGADSVGLTRTEFLFIERDIAPDVREQRDAYQAVLDAMQGRPVIIRTMDVGGDKEVPYLPLPPEPNPALGLRGIRSGMADPHILDAQLEALLSVAPLSSLRILLPMVTEANEIIAVRARIDLIAQRLGLRERPQLGAMIEVPSAALLAEQLARHADFLSIGTNDLTQYALAMDRCNAALAPRLDSLHPALLRLIAMTVEGARQHGKWVGVCGALASDPDAVPVLVGLGVTELSVSAALVPEIKQRVRTLEFAACQREVVQLLGLPSAAQVRDRARHCWPAI